MKRSLRVKSPSKKALDASDQLPPSPSRARPNKKQKASAAPPSIKEVVEDIMDKEEDGFDAFADATAYPEDDEEVLMEERRKLEYECSVKVVYNQKERALRELEVNASDKDVVSQAHAIADATVIGDIIRTKVIASYKGMKKADAFAIDVANDEAFEKCLERLLAWDAIGKEGFKVAITVFLEKAAQFTVAVGRSVTARQEAGLLVVYVAMEEQGDYSAAIRA